MQEIIVKFINVYIQFFIETYIVFYILCNSFPLKINKKKAYFIAIAFANYMPITDALSLVLVGGCIIPYTNIVFILLKINIFVEALTFLLFVVLFVDKVWYRCCWWPLVLILIMTLPSIFYFDYFTTMDKVTGVTVIPVQLDTMLLYLISPFIQVLCGLAFLKIGKNLSKVKMIKTVSKWYLYIFYMCYLLLLMFNNKDYFQDDNKLKVIAKSNCKNLSIFVVGILILLFIAINQTEKKSLKIENALLLQHKRLQYMNYLSFIEQGQEISKLYSEIGGHIKDIRILVSKGEDLEAENYTQRLLQQYRKAGRDYYCNNKIINAVLISKGKVCGQNNIVYYTDIKLPEHVGVRDIDLMCVFTNLLDNAIESNLRYPGEESYIRVLANTVGNYLTVKVINSKSGENMPVKDKGQYITWKKDKRLHGYGLRIIYEIAERYEGQAEFVDQGEEFVALVMLRTDISAYSRLSDA